MPGHLFVVRGDLTHLASDAWLLPTDHWLGITSSWRDFLPEKSLDGTRLAVTPPQGWGGSVRSFPLEDVDQGGPCQPWVTAIGTAAPDIEAYLGGLRAFVEGAAAEVTRRGPAYRRAKPLLGVPFLGSGAGGGAAVKGHVLQTLIGELLRIVDQDEVDIALVTHDAAAFSAAQAVRAEVLDRTKASLTELNVALSDEAERLGQLAAEGRLVLFLGAGVSAGAGLPLWPHLLRELADRAGISVRDRSALEELPPVDQARIVEARLGRKRVVETIDEIFTTSHHSLSHALLACLPVTEVVTTNYDDLFEDASRACGRSLAVLPYESAARSDRWILKLHGSVGRDDVVITRDDYLSMPRQRGALTSIVQALLITRAMLFVGYSLRDDDFHELVHDVREAVRGDDLSTQQEPFATALLLQEAPVLAELWTRDVRCIGASPELTSAPEAARQLEIMLDTILAQATVHRAFLLDPTYQAIISGDDVRIRKDLTALRATVASAASSPVRRLVAGMLRNLGGGDDDS